ncbi:unnamed protein product [Callosobruchus maculatus]|uniref:C2H2-type domain-containing protein n=1 Tax=Callosobruchus maculatus TaxID=64391 RepID=A0A653CN68_CALMS|nr:unnamed protein product [Callosobruchus maculatus]
MIRISVFSVTENEIPRKDEEVVADMETAGDTFVCYHCEYAARSKRHLVDHMKVHRNRKCIYSCCYCDFGTNSGKLFTTHNKTHSSESEQLEALHMKEENIDDNFSQGNTILIDSETSVVNKTSSRARKSVSSKVHQCTECNYKTTKTEYLKKHLVTHSDNRITSRCIYCNKTIKRKLSLDDHIIKTHPDFIASVSSKIHECTQCTYKTTIARLIRGHLSTKHPEIADNRTFSRCMCCNKTFNHKERLNEHIVRRHPDFVASVNSKIHECTQCTYKTTIARCIREHLSTKHPEIAGNGIVRCIHCNKTFARKQNLDDHIVRSHPDFIASVSREVHECTKCTFKTVFNRDLKRHMITHSHTADNNRIDNRCIYCDTTFAHKQSRDEHIVRRHPDFIASVSRKIYECAQCIYKSTNAKSLREHSMAKHPETTGNRTIKQSCVETS